MLAKYDQNMRIIIEGGNDQKTYYYAAFIEGLAGDRVFVVVPSVGGYDAQHEFDRNTGIWLAGPCLNLMDAKVFEPDMKKIMPKPIELVPISETTLEQ